MRLTPNLPSQIVSSRTFACAESCWGLWLAVTGAQTPFFPVWWGHFNLHVVFVFGWSCVQINPSMSVRVELHALRSLSLPPHGSLQCLREQEFAGSWMSCHKAWLPLGRVPQKADSEVEIYTEQVPRRQCWQKHLWQSEGSRPCRRRSWVVRTQPMPWAPWSWDGPLTLSPFGPWLRLVAGCRVPWGRGNLKWSSSIWGGSHQQTAGGRASLSWREVEGVPCCGPSESEWPGMLVRNAHVWVERR